VEGVKGKGEAHGWFYPPRTSGFLLTRSERGVAKEVEVSSLNKKIISTNSGAGERK